MDKTIGNTGVRACVDLGAIEEPLLICGGAYGNLQALEAFLETAARMGIPVGRIVHTGDAVAYCGDPEATTVLLRDSGVHCIQGNVEESLFAGMPDCGCGFEPGSACDRLSDQWFAFADAHMSAAARQWMGRLPHFLTFTMAGRRVRVLHGGAREINRFYFESTPENDLVEEFGFTGADVIVAGHSGLPFTRQVGACLWHNSGALGMPANDGTPRVWFSLMQPHRGGILFRHLPLAYNHAAAKARMTEGGLPEGYVRAIVTGLWPSLSILPEAERARTGMAIAPRELTVLPLAESPVS
ncbi:MAG: metallophosphoesterase family protein [Pseudomonadota bacterium]|nr:metallophosphoesterase family protein [Pseudomonadota bacterium]